MRLLGVILPILVVGASVSAQKLSLGARPARPDSSVAAIALRDRLDAAIAASPKATERQRAGVAIRSLARHLTQRAMDAGPRAGAHLIVARTLAANFQELDRLLADEDLVDDALIALLLHDLEITDRDLPLEPEDLDRFMRDTFAQILDRLPDPPGAYAWTGESQPIEPHAALSDAWLDTLVAAGIAGDAAQAVLNIREDVREALAWRAYRAEASRLVRSIEGAGAVIDERFTWVPPSSRDALVRSIGTHFLSLDSDRRDAAIQSLDALARAGAAFELAHRLGDGPYATQARSALVQLAVAANLSRPAESARLDAFTRVLLLALASLPDERRTIRQLRPIHRLALGEADRTEALLLRSLAPVLQRDDAMADPGTVAAIGAHRQSVGDVRDIAAVSRWLAEQGAGLPEPIASPERRAIADHLLTLTRDDADYDQAVAMIRDLAGQIDRFDQLPGESELRLAAMRAGTGSLTGASTIWADATGYRQNEIVALVDRLRNAWSEGWSRRFELGNHPTDFAQFDAARMLVETIGWAQIVSADAASTADDRAVRSPLQAWPGFELSPAALRAIMPPTADLAEAARLLVADRPGDTMDVMRKLRADHPAFELIARLESQAAAHSLERTAEDDQVLYELCSGPPPAPWRAQQAWLASSREDIADLCRYAEELAALRALNDTPRADATRAYVDDLATTILESLED